MFCPQCGTSNDDRSLHCVQCGTALSQAAIAPPPQFGTPPMYQQPLANVPSYMVQSVLLTLFCCMPLGIAGIVKANKVNKLLRLNDVSGAMAESSSNKTLLWVGFGVGAVINLGYIVSQMNH